MTTIRTVPLDTPLKRGDETIDSLQLRKPGAGELRGLNLADVVQLNVNAIAKLLPRIATPAPTLQEIDAMDPADFVAISAEIADFLTPKAEKQASPQA